MQLDIMDILTDAVCELANLRPTNEWPEEVWLLIGAARAVKSLYGMEVEVVKLSLRD